MMALDIYTVDAFSSAPFSGNPAAVCLVPYKSNLTDEQMQKIAGEMNLSETAFIRILQDQGTFAGSARFGLRWFTPLMEADLCGHATVAAAAVLYKCVGNQSGRIAFETLSGDVFVSQDTNNITIDFPLNTPEKQEKSCYGDLLQVAGLSEITEEVYFNSTLKYLLVRLKDGIRREDFENIATPAADKTVQTVKEGSMIVTIITAKGPPENGFVDSSGKHYDFLCRVFAPWAGIPEDPVTGSAQTVLAGYWMQKLNKKSFYVRQCSKRGGDIHVAVREDGRVDISGPATVVLQGTINYQ